MRVAALTMAYNEPLWAPAWARHYAAQVGVEHCYLLDHGSSDGSTSGLGVHVHWMPRSPLDEDARAAVVAGHASRLLQTYDAVVHSDVDELALADPARYVDLRAFAAASPHPVVTAIGLDLQHLPDEEPTLDARLPLGAQRAWVRFSAAMCKPVFIRHPVRWRPGFHGCDAAPVFGGLYLVHLRYADLGHGLLRLARTRGQEFADPAANPHQRVPDREFEGMVRAIAALPRRAATFDPAHAPLRPWLERLQAGWDVGDPMLSLAGDALWRLPRRFRERL